MKCYSRGIAGGMGPLILLIVDSTNFLLVFHYLVHENYS